MKGAPLSKRLIFLAVAVAALLAAGSAFAITGGQRDGNAHPNVGAMMTFDDPSAPTTLQEVCSGTLVAPQVFLTAAHCTDFLLNDLGTTDVWVTFNTNSAEGPYIPGSMVQNPEYNGKPAQNGNDIAVILLDSAPEGITPANLPPVGLFDAMKADKTLTQSSAFTAVGYGDGAKQVGDGKPTFYFDGFRWNHLVLQFAAGQLAPPDAEPVGRRRRYLLRRLGRAELPRHDSDDRGDHDLRRQSMQVDQRRSQAGHAERAGLPGAVRRPERLIQREAAPARAGAASGIDCSGRALGRPERRAARAARPRPAARARADRAACRRDRRVPRVPVGRRRALSRERHLRALLQRGARRARHRHASLWSRSRRSGRSAPRRR